MADKAISELIAANQVTPTDLFVLEQSGTAKKLTGQILENWLVSFADGHGGIQSIAKVSTSGLVDTYRITLADTTTFDFLVTNGKSINSITKTGTAGLVDTYSITYNDGSPDTFTVTNGAKGDKGDNTYTWIKYASQQPTESSHSFGDVPDNWIGIYAGASSTAPTDWQEYSWFQIKGEKGDTGAAATVSSNVVAYQVSDSGTIIPSGEWVSSIPVVAQGKYLWTRTTTTFNTGSPAVSYSVSRMGLDGTGSVSSVAGVSPDANGNVPLTAESIKALSTDGGTMSGGINMNGQPISGLNAPTANDQAANMGFVNQQVKKAAPRNLLVNSYFTNPVNQRGQTSYVTANAYTVDRWKVVGAKVSIAVNDDSITIKTVESGGSTYFIQYIEHENVTLGKTYTAAAKLKDGTMAIVKAVYATGMSATVTSFGGDNTKQLRISLEGNGHLAVVLFTNSTTGMDVEWVALYEGEYTAETLPEYQPKGYGAELAECQRYFQKITDGNTLGFGMIQSNLNAVVQYPLPVPLRTTPTVTYKYSTESDRLILVGIDGITYIVSLAITRANSNGVQMAAKVNTQLTATTRPAVLGRGGDATIELSADL